MIYSLICTDTSKAIHWQCELLEYSWSKCEQPGELVRLVACDPEMSLPEHRHANVVRTNFTNVDSETGDHYAPYNRLYSIQEWLHRDAPNGTVLILDPDMIFRNSVKTEVKRGSPIGQQWVGFGMRDRKKRVTMEISNVDIAQIQPVTWPALIHSDDLIRLIPRWIELTIEYRRRTGGWEDDMFAFAVASAELGIVYAFKNMAAWTPWAEEKVTGAPIVHYCQAIQNRSDEIIWAKNKYQPWDRVKTPQAAKLDYCRDLLSLVDKHAILQNTATKFKRKKIFVAIASYCEPELISTIENCMDKAFSPENLRFGICLQYDNEGSDETKVDCLDRYLSDNRFRFVKYDYRKSKGGCWARNICQDFYQGEAYTLQIDAHSQFIEGWDSILIQMLLDMPSEKPLITSFPPLYTRDENNHITLSHLHDLQHIHTTVAGTWKKAGWIVQSNKFIPENNTFPRRTRFLSGAFVFTLGQWNDEVRQDPEHFYTGEEFALTLRSFTHGYDLFDPSQIVVWHRLHPKSNRKYWHDNAESATHERHNKAIARLTKLQDGDPYQELGRYSLGKARTIEDFRIYSGLDCSSLSVHSDAVNGVPPDPVTIRVEGVAADEMDVSDEGVKLSLNSDTDILQLTVYLDDMDPLEFDCNVTDPILLTLFEAMLRNRHTGARNNEEVMYLQIGEKEPKVMYFLSSKILALETSPPLGAEFFAKISDQESQPVQSTVLKPVFNDSWKFWIWNDVNRGCTKHDIFQILLNKGFAYDDIRYELGYDPGLSPEQNGIDQALEIPTKENYFIANAERLDNPKIELYVVKDFLNEQECEQLLEKLKGNLIPSTTVGIEGAHEGRTSRTSYFKINEEIDPLALEVRERLCKLIGFNPNYAEGIQGHMYEPGEEYKPHFDWFDPNSDDYEENASAEKGGQRTWSVVVYLNDVEQGGGTRFVDIDETIEPERGKAVVWNNLLPSGRVNLDVMHHALPVVRGTKAVITFWFRSKREGEMLCREPGEEVPNHTKKGYKKISMPRELFNKLNEFYHNNTEVTSEESIPEFLTNENVNKKVSDLVMLPRELKVEISHALKPVMEEWSNLALESTAVYGLRRYHRGASLKMHRDTTDTHIISAILNIEQDVDTDWPLEIEDNFYRRHRVMLHPGDMLLYESARVLHGRPSPLEGKIFCNVFVHFMPLVGDSAKGDEIRV